MAHFVRESPRHQVEIAVRVTCDSWADYLDLYTANLSRGGVFIASPLSAPIGTEMRVDLMLPAGNTLTLHGEVVHLVGAAESAESGLPAGMGLMFLDLDDGRRQELDRLARGAPRPGLPPPPADALAGKADALAGKADAPAPRKPRFGDVVEQKLLEELARRLDLEPWSQLDLERGASESAIAEAHARLSERYAPTIFERYGSATVAIAKNLLEVLDRAVESLRAPAAPAAVAPPPSREAIERKQRGEEARRALHSTIERRVEEACRLRDLGQLVEAARGFEQVLELDRSHEYARQELRHLRGQLEPKSDVKSIIAKLKQR